MAYEIQVATGTVLSWLLIGCSDGTNDDFQFSESDMRAVVAGNWSGTIHGTGETVLLQLAERNAAVDTSSSTAGESPGAIRRLASCGSRQFGNRQLRCIAVTSMSIEGSISTAENTLAQTTLSGGFDVDGNELAYGQLHLASENGSILWGTFSAHQFTDWTYSTSIGATFTLDLQRQ